MHQANRLQEIDARRARLEEARTHYVEALVIRSDAKNLYNLAVALMMQGELASAAEALADSVARNPDLADVWNLLGVVRLRQGRPAQAADALDRAAVVGQKTPDPDKTDEENNQILANIWANLGTVRWQLGQRDRAAACWDEALQLNPAEVHALNGQGLLLLRQGRLKAAVDRFTAAVQIEPRLIEAHSNLGVALGRLDDWSAASSQAEAVRLEVNRLSLMNTPDYTELALYRRRLAFTLRAFAQDQDAAKEYREALRLDPTWPPRCIQQAWRLAADPDAGQRDPAAAVELASQACQATSDPSAAALDALAAALAAAGRFPDAVRTARQALERAPPALARHVRQRLQLYEKGKPYVRGS
jgi:tetratricopeptide (TPR) repeat protein